MKKIRLLLIMSVAAAITSCSKDNDRDDNSVNPGPQSTTEAFATFTISVPKNPAQKVKTTKATDEGTADETNGKNPSRFYL